ncbi:MAG: ABC transporter transmembrane domain-containing protein, partial [Prevotella nigrescens]
MIRILKRLGHYMGGRKPLLPCSIVLSAVNGLLSLVPFIFLWLVVRTLLTADGNLADTPVWDYAIAAFVVSVANVLLYFAALMLSHLSAFRIETNMRRTAMERLMRVPLGFFDTQNTGRMRKIIDEDSSQTHTFVAHILPDVAGSVVAPIGIIVLLLAVDWQLGIAAMVPIVCAFGIMGYMMNPKNNDFLRIYLDAQEKMSAEAVEYVRGIPVVKVFQQTVFSFKRFHDSIINYRDLVIRYTLLWRMPMSAYTIAINAFAFLLVPTGIILIGHGGETAIIVSDMVLYVLIAPIIAANVMKAMHLSQNLFLANEAVDRLEKLTATPPLPESSEPEKAAAFDVSLRNVSFRYEAAECDAVSHIDLVLVLGGDGTILRAFEIARERDIPLVGINTGHVGFLAEADPDGIEQVVADLVAGRYTVETRTTLDVEVICPDGTVTRDWALNEAALEKRDRARMIEVAIGVDGQAVSSFGCDGLIMSTPTG